MMAAVRVLMTRKTPGAGGPAPGSRSVRAVLRALHAVLDPVGTLHAVGRVHAFRRVVDDVGDRRRAGRLVELIGAVRGLLDALVALAERHVDLDAERLVFEVLERL